MDTAEKMMETLFDITPRIPQGFLYIPNFLTEDEETELAGLIDTYPLHNMQFQGFEAKRKVMSFGYDYHFDKRNLTPGLPIPEELQPLIHRVAEQLNIRADKFAKVLLTEYPTGSVINWHRDAAPFDVIAGVSLLCDCVFKLRPYQKTERTRKNTISFNVQRRSLYLLAGNVREYWEHSIAPVKERRFSVTLRTLR